MPPPTNVVILLADQWRGIDQGWRGNQQIHTPHLDRLAETGVAIPGAYANAPVCGPSRGCLVTGQLPHRHEVVANDIPLAAVLPTIGDVLKGEGYRTGWIGKWHLDGLPRDKWVPPERRRGFDYWAATNCSHHYFDAHYYTGADPAKVPFRGYEPRVQTGLALDFLHAESERPFFLVVSYGPPHDPYPDVPAEYLERYIGSELTTRPNAPHASRARLRQYYAAITAIDEQVGRVVAELDRLGLSADTLLVVTSDHGDMLGSQGLTAKQVPYEEAINVPLVFSQPGRLPAREVRSGVMGLVDLAPTVLGLVGAPALPDAYGADLSAAVDGTGTLRDAVLLTNPVSCDNGYRQGVPEWRGMRTETHTYARRVDGDPWLLYDNVADPLQQDNLVGTDAVEEADRILDSLLHEAGDTPRSAPETLRALGLVEAWNGRERELHGADARIVSA